MFLEFSSSQVSHSLSLSSFLYSTPLQHLPRHLNIFRRHFAYEDLYSVSSSLLHLQSRTSTDIHFQYPVTHIICHWKRLFLHFSSPFLALRSGYGTWLFPSSARYYPSHQLYLIRYPHHRCFCNCQMPLPNFEVAFASPQCFIFHVRTDYNSELTYGIWGYHTHLLFLRHTPYTASVCALSVFRKSFKCLELSSAFPSFSTSSTEGWTFQTCEVEVLCCRCVRGLVPRTIRASSLLDWTSV